jgi:hypothetical protein
MQHNTRDSLLLQLPLKEAYGRVLTGTLENVGVLFGLSEAKTRSLCGTAARVFSCLCGAAIHDGLVVDIVPSGSTVQVVFTFSADPADLSGFDPAMAEPMEQKSGSGPGETASFGGVDLFRIRRSGGMEVKIVLGQEKEYPFVSRPAVNLATPVPPFQVVSDPSADEILETCLSAQSAYPPYLLHKSLFQPSKVVDMVDAEEMSVCVALDRSRRPSGMICWQPAGRSHAIFFGPYIFMPGPGAARELPAWCLTENFLSRASRSGLSGVFSGLSTPELPVEGFEELGTVRYSLESGSYMPIATYYRHLREDPGGAVWAHPAIEEYLRQTYERFSFVREICPTSVCASPTSPRTVFFAEIRKELQEAVLRPLSVGPDVKQTVFRHVKSLNGRGIRNIFFHVDLAFAWQARLAPDLLENGFRPAFLLPCAGTSDLLIFHYDETSTT